MEFHRGVCGLQQRPPGRRRDDSFADGVLLIKTESTEGAWAEENAASALWALAFTEANKARMLEHKADLQQELVRICERSGEHSEDTTFAVIAAARRAKMDAAYLLLGLDEWKLGLAESDDESDESDDHQTHVMISYADEQADLAMPAIAAQKWVQDMGGCDSANKPLKAQVEICFAPVLPLKLAARCAHLESE